MSNETITGYDFAGWATRNDIKCSDGRTIRDGAFAHMDGKTVPLVYQHDHQDINNVLGKVLLKNVSPRGVRAYGFFNNTNAGQTAKEAVIHGDLTSLSVYANHLKQRSGDVLHGEIKEVSLVQAGANPGALIDVIISHSDEEGYDEETAFITWGEDEAIEIKENAELGHSDEEPVTKNDGTSDQNVEHSNDELKKYSDIFKDMTEEQKDCCYFMMGEAVKAVEPESVQHADEATDGDTVDVAAIVDTMSPVQKECSEFLMQKAASGEALNEQDDLDFDPKEVYDSMDPDQQQAVNYLVGLASKENDDAAEHSDESVENNNEEENVEMKHNAFENASTAMTEQEALCHSFIEELDFDELVKSSKSSGKTFGQTFLAHADEYGIENLDLLFPDYKSLSTMPEFIKRPDDWVSKILNGVKKVPFAKVRTLFADITADEARARGYTKGHKKVEEVFTLLKREVSPTTIYKKQKLDRDDLIDLANLDIIGWLRQEMRMMLDEEIARAILVSDGRDPLADADNKIKEDKIIPMIYDDVLFTINKDTTGAAKDVIQTAIRARKDYRGSGRPVFITTEDYVTEMLLMEDLNQRVIYETEDKLKTALRVSDIITVPVLEGVKNKAETKELVGIIVNLSDYCVGSDKGGAINWFDDFDIDFNQQKYLIETRCSGALIKPKSCIVLWKPVSQSANTEPETDNNQGG